MIMDTDQLATDLVTRNVVGQVINAIASRDWETLAACVAPDVVYWRPGTSDRVDGVRGYVSEWRSFVERTADLRYRPHTVLVQGDTAMVEATAEWTEPTGAPVVYSMVTIMKVVGGRLAEEREYIVPRTDPRP